MTLSPDQIRKGIFNPTKGMRYVLRNGVIGVTSRRPIGTHVLSRDWSVLIILDTCRVDALRAVADEYEFLEDIGRIWSLGGSSPEWIAQTFDRNWKPTLENTAYLNVNAWAERILGGQLQSENPDIEHTGMHQLYRYGDWDVIRPDELGALEHVWKFVDTGDTDWTRTIPERFLYGRAPPRYLTDRAISVGRNWEFDRLVLHYTQPHSPYIANAMAENRGLQDYERDPVEYIQRTGDRTTAYESYLDELRYVLDDVELLLNNIEAENVVISADHGEAFGEYGVYGHHAGSLHPKIRYVPWAVTTGTDTEDYTPADRSEVTTDHSVDDALEALGYKM